MQLVNLSEISAKDYSNVNITKTEVSNLRKFISTSSFFQNLNFNLNVSDIFQRVIQILIVDSKFNKNS